MRWSAWCVAHKAHGLALVVALAALGVAGASRTGFEASYAALLSPDASSVRELEEVRRELGGGSSEIVIVLTGPTEERDSLARAVAARLELHPDIARADAELPRAFFDERALYLIDRADLDELDALVTEAIGGAASSWDAVARWGDRMEERYANGPLVRAFAGDDHRYVFVRPRVSSTELERARAIAADIREVVQELRRGDVEVEYGGRLAVHLAEQEATARDLRRATLLALGLVVLLLVVVLRRVAAPLLLAVPLVVSLSLTLAFAAALVGKLNLISAFTLPALVGLGIDFGIHLYTAFLRELDATTDRDAAMCRAIDATIGASAASALTTAAAFGSLALVEFRGFREFGLLGAGGVVITLVVTYVALPPLAVLATRERSRARAMPRRALSVSRRAALGAVIVAACATVYLGSRAPGLRFVNDFGDLKSASRAVAVTEQIEDDLGLMLAPSVFLVPDVDAARALEVAARDRRRRPGEFVGVAETFSVGRLVPADAESRAALLDGLRARLLAARAIAGARGAALDRLIALASAPPYGVDDLPEVVRRRVVGADRGGYVVLVWPDDHLYRDTVMRAWLEIVDALRADLTAVIGAGRASHVRVLDERRIPLEVVDVIARDMPRALALAAGLVLLVLAVYLRRVVPVLLVCGAMVVATVWLFGVLVVTGMQLNVYSAVVVPCIVGIGIDNAIHIHHAYDRSGSGTIGRVVTSTGAAAALASATTGIGFGAAMIARQGGLVSMGLTAVAGVACALVATTVVLPAVLRLRERGAGPV